MNRNSGWVKLWREQFTHEISERRPWCDGYAWAYLYSKANFRRSVVNFRNQYVTVERGQFVTSELKLSKIFGWTRRRTKSFLTALKIGGMCDIKRTQRFIIITVCNYDKFQSTENEECTTDVTTDVTTDAQQKHTDKNIEKEKKRTMSKNELSDFEVFYRAYPKHEGRIPAIKAWEKLLPDKELLGIILAAVEMQKRHKARLKELKEFCPEWPLPATWLNNRRWTDETPEVKPTW